MAEENQEQSPSVAGSESSEGAAKPGVRGLVERHPQLTAWLALSVIMVIMVLWSARDVDLLFRQRLAIVVTTIGLAGLCVWIIGWE